MRAAMSRCSNANRRPWGPPSSTTGTPRVNAPKCWAEPCTGWCPACLRTQSCPTRGSRSWSAWEPPETSRWSGNWRSAGALNSRSRSAQLFYGRLRRLERDPCAQVDEHAGVEAVLQRVECGVANAVVGGDAADVHIGDVVPLEPVGESGAVRRTPFEPGERRGVLALEKDRVEGLGVEVGMERRAVGVDHAVDRPTVHEVGVGSRRREMVSRINVVVPRGHRDCVVRGLRILSRPVMEQFGDLVRRPRPSGHRQAAAFAEVVLYVDNDQRTFHASEASAVSYT